MKRRDADSGWMISGDRVVYPAKSHKIVPDKLVTPRRQESGEGRYDTPLANVVCPWKLLLTI